MIKFIGSQYSTGATAHVKHGGPELAPRKVQELFPNNDWTILTNESVDDCEIIADRFGDAYNMHKKIYAATPREKHIFIGGDHSVNFSHFAAICDMYPDEDLCLVYFDAHLDIHTPESSYKEASGAPHGTNVRHLLGDGDSRWLSLAHKKPSLKPENLFYFGTRSFEASEIKYVRDNNIFFRTPQQLQTKTDWDIAIGAARKKIGNKKFIVSFDFDGLDPKSFGDVWVPEPNGLSLDFARHFINAFIDANGFEFVEWAVSGDKKCENIVHELIDIVVKSF